MDHDWHTTPGPYPEGEGPTDYTECTRCGAGLGTTTDCPTGADEGDTHA